MSQSTPEGPPPESTPSKTSDWVIGVFLAEVVAAMISVIIPLTPGRTGSGSSLAQFFISDPSFFEQAAVLFVLTNLLFGLFGLAVFIRTRSGQ